jgi:predicted DNA-binding transcriptional regulator AlpA
VSDTPENDRLLTPAQVAEILAVSRGMLAVWRHRGVGPRHVQLSPRTPRYRAADIVAYVDSHTLDHDHLRLRRAECAAIASSTTKVDTAKVAG